MARATSFTPFDFDHDFVPMRRGIAEATQTLAAAFGPKGRMVPVPEAARRGYIIPEAIDRGEAARYTHTMRGYIIAEAIKPVDHVEARGAHVIRGTSEHIAVLAGDGATTTAIITNAMLQGSERALAAGFDPSELRRGIELGIRAAVRAMRRYAHHHLTLEEICAVATTSADGDVEIGTGISALSAEFGSGFPKLKFVERPERGIAVVAPDTLALGTAFEVDATGRLYEVEIDERLSRAETAKRAISAAFEEGVVAGGGAALLHIGTILAPLSANRPGEHAGIAVVHDALQAPAEKLAENIGFVGAEVCEQIRRHAGLKFGYDVVAGRYTDMFEAGVIDPAKTLRIAIQSAGQVAEAFIVAGEVAGLGGERIDRMWRENPYLGYLFPDAQAGEVSLESVTRRGVQPFSRLPRPASYRFDPSDAGARHRFQRGCVRPA